MVLFGRLVRALLRNPGLTLLGIVAIAAAIVWEHPGAHRAVFGASDGVEARAGTRAREVDPTKPINARVLLGRVWFDRYPKTSRDQVKIFIFLGGGIGIYETGSVWKTSYEVFDFERQGDSVTLEFLQDGKKATTAFSIATCEDQPPFDVCLTLVDPPRGPTKLYAFATEEETSTHLPWASALMDTARTLAATNAP